jgi:phosphoribosylformimino-5-aminoimidazole carboxamide ribotide isomerase
MQIIPAIDLIDGKCVRLTQGDYAQKKVYNEDPLEAAKQFESAGIQRLHLVDLDGARTGKITNLRVLEKIAAETQLQIDFGGGIKKEEDLVSVFNAGAQLATIGSLSVKEPEIFYSLVKKYGAGKFLLGADVKNEKIAVNGWLEETDLSLYDFIAANIEQGVKNIFCTDISKDGMLQGPAIDLYKKILDAQPEVKLIASGGISGIGDLEKLKNNGLHGAIIGKAIYEGKISLNDLKKYL